MHQRKRTKTDMQHSETVTISITSFGAIKFLCNNIIFSENLSLLLLSEDENFKHSTSSRTRQQLSSAEIDNRNSCRQTLTSIVVLSHKRAIYKSCRWHFQEFSWVFFSSYSFRVPVCFRKLVSINIQCIFDQNKYEYWPLWIRWCFAGRPIVAWLYVLTGTFNVCWLMYCP